MLKRVLDIHMARSKSFPAKSRLELNGMFVAGFDGTSLPKETAELLAEGLAGVALFARNIENARQVTALCRQIRHAASRAGVPPIIAVDQEGGRVQRLRGIVDSYPSMREVPDPFAAGKSIGADLARLGFNLDFAPVLDVDSNPQNPIIGDRSFSSDSEQAGSRAVEFYRGLAVSGIVGCGKHFPGHGDASADSHLELPVIDIDRQMLENRELVPFQAAVSAGFMMFMTAHCLYPAIDPKLPATLSRHFIKPFLREKLGFDGVVITDDLGMKAIADSYGPRQVVSLGVRAGIDIFLHCGVTGQVSEYVDALSSCLDEGCVSGDDVSVSLERVRRLRGSLS